MGEETVADVVVEGAKTGVSRLDQALADIINTTLDGVEATKDFLVAEVPDVVMQLLLWYGVYNFILFCIAILIFVGMVWFNIRQAKWIKKNWDNWRGEEECVLFLNILQSVPFAIALCCLNLQWLKIWIAPKVWLIEFARDLMRGV